MCEFCGRTIKTTEHHLIPRSRKRHEAGFGPVAQFCADCHRKVHATWDNKTLAKSYDMVDKLKAAPELQTYLKWIRKQPSTVYFGSIDKK
jgi:5-methylcytosine-specific restriction protein A